MESKLTGKRNDLEEPDHEEEKTAPIYYFKDGYRYVKDHLQILNAHTKKRWIGCTIFEVLTKEFKLYPAAYYEDAIDNGKITINGKKCTKDQMLKDGQLITHELVKTERRVLDRPINIIFEDKDYLVVNKPPSIPIHEAGSFYYNSLSLILKHEKGYENLLVGHRLDRQTSGICLFSKNREAARRYSELLREEKMHKVYIARVVGKVTPSKFTIDKPMYNISFKYAVHNCAEKQEANDPQKYKEAVTDFKVMSYSPSLDCTILKCYPRTGRTHQIRVHLKSIGHPIENDKMYRTIYEMSKDSEKWKAMEDNERVFCFGAEIKGIHVEVDGDQLMPNIPSEDFDELYLHAYKYKFGKYKFRTELPEWANLVSATTLKD